MALFAIGCGGSDPHSTSPSPTPEPTPEAPAAGVFVYVVNPDAWTISGFSVGQSTGALTPLSSSPTTLTGPPVALAIDSQARFAFVGLRGSADVLATYAIDRQTGALILVPSSGLAMPPIYPEQRYEPPCASERMVLSSLALHPSGRFAYAVFDGAECICGTEAWIYTYAIDSATGRLTRVDLPPVRAGRAGVGDAPAIGVSVVSVATGPYLYAANRGVRRGGIEGCDVASDLRGFAVDPGTGALREVRDSPFAEGRPNDREGHRWLALRSGADLLYLARQQDTVQFSVNAATGALTKRSTRSSVIGPVAFSPTDRLYSAASVGGASGIQAFEIQADTGDLIATANGFVATPGAVTAIAIDSSGRYLYAVQAASGVVSAFTIEARNGALARGPNSLTPVGIESGAVSDFRTVAIANVP